jgi:hypothetical protein
MRGIISLEDLNGYFDLDPQQEMWLLEQIIHREISRGDLRHPVADRERDAFVRQCRHRIQDRLMHATPHIPAEAMLEALKGRFRGEEFYLLVGLINEARGSRANR